MNAKNQEYLNLRTMKKSEGRNPSDFAASPTRERTELMNTLTTEYTQSQDSDNLPVENTILQTTNYGQFRCDRANRPVDMDRVYKLCEAIAKKNLLRLFPIVVNPEFVVIDGQHRLKAAELLETPIFYIVSKQMQMEDAAAVVRHTAGWSIDDWLHHWCERGNPQYRLLRDFWAAHRWLPLSCAARLCQSQKHKAGDFAEGHFVADSIGFANRVCEMAKDFQTWFSAYNSTTFINLLIQLAANDTYSHKHMMSKMQYLSAKLVRCPTVEMYLALITEIYNYKVRPDRHVIFRAKARTDRKDNGALKQ